MKKGKTFWILILFLLCWGTLAARTATVSADTSFHIVCADPTATLTVDSAQSYHWSTNEISQSIIVSAAGTYTVTSTGFDGIQTVDTFQVAIIKTNRVSNLSIPNMCAGGNYPITIGHDSINDIVIESHEASMVLSETIFLPDGVSCDPYGCSYRSPLTFTNFPEGETIASVNDILFVRLNLEHSYAADLYINLTCPNGQNVDILRFGGSTNSNCSSNIPPSSRGWLSGNNASGGTDFGLANNAGDWDINPNCTPTPPGTGWNYCWSNNSTYGYASGDGKIYRSANAHDGHFDSSNVANHSQFYHPDQSFQGLVGCPLNGSWYIEVMDGYSQNNGYLFEWELALSSDMQTEYSDVVRTELEGPWVNTLSNSTFVISPPADLPHDTAVNYTFHFYNEYGCSYDTIVTVSFFAKSQKIIDSSSCESIIWRGVTYLSDTTLHYKLTNSHGCDSLVTVNLHVFTAPTVTISGPSILCGDSTVTLAAVTSDEPLSYLWSNGATDSTITVSEPGMYSVTAFFAGGCYSESVDFHLFESGNPIIDAHLSDMVAGDTQNVVIGTQAGDNLEYFVPENTLRDDNVVFLPDGYPCPDIGCSYQSTLTFTEFPDTAVLTSVEDIHYVRLKMEHSYIKDLYITLQCDNGQRSVILKKSTPSSSTAPSATSCLSQIPMSDRGWQSGSNVGEAFLGRAWDQADPNYCDPTTPDNRPGSGWNYCWSNNTTENYGYASGDGLIYRSANAHYHSVNGQNKRIIDSSNVANGTQFYHPDMPFDSLVGCPLNGNWTIQVMDGINHDNGYIFSWEISFADHLFSSHSAPVTETICEGPWLTSPITDSTYAITPPDSLAHDTSVTYTFTLINEIGCVYDTSVIIHVYAHKYVDEYDTVYISELEDYEWHGKAPAHPGTLTDTMTTQHGADSIITLHLSVIYPSDTNICENDLPMVWHGHTFTAEDTIATVTHPVNGADSIEVLSVSLLPISRDTVEISECDSLTWIDGHTYYESTSVPSYTLSNAQNCDSIVTLHLTIYHSASITIYDSACTERTWNGSTYNQSGEYPFVTTDIHGCDSTVILHLTIFDPDTTPVFATGCGNYSWNGSTYYQSGEYYYHTTNIHGCDSTVILHLTILDLDTTHIPYGTCESYTWHGTTYYHSGDYPFDTLNMDGCDSTVILHLTIFDTNVVHVFDTACLYQTWHGSTYYQSNEYTFDTINIHGCDSTVILHLTIFEPDTTHIPIIACGSYTWHGSTYYQSGNYPFDTLTMHGCDSTAILHLTILDLDTIPVIMSACGSYTWHGTTYYQSGDYPFDTLNMEGCDSTVILHLTIFPIPDIQISGPAEFCADTFSILSVGGGNTYLWNTGDTLQQIVVTEPGLYSVVGTDANGCKATATHRIVSAHVTPIASLNMPVICAGTSETITVGYLVGSSILLSGPEESPSADFDTITKVTHVTMTGLWVTVPAINDSSFLLSPPADLPDDTTVHYLFHLEDNLGCGYDTIIPISFLAHHLIRIDTSVCNAFTWNGITYTNTGTYKQPQANPNGCTDTVVIHLTVNHSSSSSDTLYLIENQLPYHFVPTDTVFGTNSPNQFQFDYTIPIQQECDSIIHQTVIIYPNIHQVFDTTVCSLPTVWHGHTFTGADTVTDTLTTIHSSDSIVTYILHIDNLAASINTVSHVICFGESTGAATATVSGGIAPYSYHWTDTSGNGISITLEASNLPAGNYIFTVTDLLGCTAKDTITVNTMYDEMRPGTIADDQAICDGESLQGFTGTEAVGGDNSVYQWQVSVAGLSEWGEAPGIYNQRDYTYSQPVTEPFLLRRAWISQHCGTRYSDTLTIQLWPIHRDTITDHTCQHEPYTENGFDISAEETAVPGLIEKEQYLPTAHCDSIVVLMLTVMPHYEETFEDEVCEGSGYYEHGFNINATETIDTDTLLRRLDLHGEYGCDSTLELHLTVIDTSIRIISSNPDFCETMSTELSVITEMNYYEWNTGDQMQSITATNPGYYIATARQGECISTANFVIEPCVFVIALPNAISPTHSDGLNDCFQIPEFMTRDIFSFEISIFNRWGEQVFYSTDKNFRWNGEYKGKILPNTIYTYIIRYTNSIGKPFVLRGSVTVL